MEEISYFQILMRFFFYFFLGSLMAISSSSIDFLILSIILCLMLVLRALRVSVLVFALGLDFNSTTSFVLTSLKKTSLSSKKEKSRDSTDAPSTKTQRFLFCLLIIHYFIQKINYYLIGHIATSALFINTSYVLLKCINLAIIVDLSGVMSFYSIYQADAMCGRI